MAPRKNPPLHAAEEIRALASTGFSRIGIAAHLSTSADTLSRWFEDYPALQAAFDLGREHERQALHNVLYKLAIEDRDKVAAMFLLKARHGYREGDQSHESNRVAITFNLPGALKADDYKLTQVIDGAGASTKQLSDATS